jgi:2-keto-4-pentenoate hydratase
MSASLTDDQLLGLLAQSQEIDDLASDIEKHAAGLTRDDAYRLQVLWKRRQAAAGDPLVGYRISMTSRNGMRESVNLGLIPWQLAGTITPVFSSLSASNLGTENEVIEVRPDRLGYVEAEVGIIMGKRLAGPGVTAAAALLAVAGYVPAIDLAGIPRERRYGLIHTLATMAGRHDTTVVIGPMVTPPPVNLPLEGVLVSVNGEPRASATAWEVMGNPVNALVWLANTLGKAGGALEPGHLVLTGAAPYPQRLAAGDVTARADVTTLGGVSVRLSVRTPRDGEA